jgi:hypothetical protein
MAMTGDAMETASDVAARIYCNRESQHHIFLRDIIAAAITDAEARGRRVERAGMEEAHRIIRDAAEILKNGDSPYRAGVREGIEVLARPSAGPSVRRPFEQALRETIEGQGLSMRAMGEEIKALKRDLIASCEKNIAQHAEIERLRAPVGDAMEAATDVTAKLASECPSTHCNRRGECASPSECCSPYRWNVRVLGVLRKYGIALTEGKFNALSDALAEAMRRMAKRDATPAVITAAEARGRQAERETCEAEIEHLKAEVVAVAGTSYFEALGWAIVTFGQVAADKRERVLRFVEEAIEVAHSGGLSVGDLSKIIDRVMGREIGDLNVEIAQAALTLGTLAAKIGLNLREAEAAEFLRIKAIPKEEWERRHAVKRAMGIAL